MNWNTKVLIFISMVIIGGLPMWLTDYKQFSNNPLISVYGIAATTLFASIIAYKTENKYWNIILFVIGAHQLAYIVKIVLDCIPDPSNHNLAPFEILGLIIVDLIICSLTIAIGRVIRENSKDNN